MHAKYFTGLGTRVLVLSVLVGINACGADSGEAEVAPVADVHYVASTVIYSGDDAQGYLVPVSSLNGKFDLEHAIEVPESIVASRPGDPYFFSATVDDPVITRWKIESDGALAADRKLSFAALGLSHAWAIDPNLFYSDERAYFTNDSSQEVVIWNPRAMKLVGTIPLELDLQAHEGLQPALTLTVRQDRLFVVVSWQADFSGDWSRFGDQVEVIEIDPQTNEVTASTSETRCNSFTWTSTTSQGTTYFSPMSWYAPIRSMLGADRGIDSCALRVVAAGHGFDDSYQLDLSSLVGGRPAGTLFLVDDDAAFLRVWHSELVDDVASDKSNWEDVLNQAGFLWWRWQIGSDAAEQIDGQEPGASEVSALFELDGRKYLPRTSADYSSTTLDEMVPAGALKKRLSGPGLLRGIVRVR